MQQKRDEAAKTNKKVQREAAAASKKASMSETAAALLEALPCYSSPSYGKLAWAFSIENDETRRRGFQSNGRSFHKFFATEYLIVS